MQNTTNCVWLKLVSFRGGNDAKSFRGEKTSLLTIFVSSKQDKRFAVEIDIKPLNTCNRNLFLTHVPNVYVSFQLLYLPKADYNTLDQTVITQGQVELVYRRGLQEMEDVWVEMNFQSHQMDQLKTQIKLSLTSNLRSAVRRVRTESIHLEKHVDQCIFIFVEKWQLLWLEKIFAQKKCRPIWAWRTNVAKVY